MRRPTRAAPPSKEEQLARLMLEVGVEASAAILERVRSRVRPDGSVPPSAAPAADPRQAHLCGACPEYYCGCSDCMRRFGAELAAQDRG